MSRRMVSDIVLGGDKFLAMPLSTQMLYVHYLLDADNAGFFSSALTTMRKVGASHDDYQMLLDQGYLLRFPSGVHCITHWNMMQSLKNDRKNTTFAELKQVRLDGGMYVMRNQKDSEDEDQL